MNEKYEQGEAFMRTMQPAAFVDAMRAAVEGGGFGADLGRFAVEHAFADVWSRPGLDKKFRSMIVISVLIAQGQEHELRNHVRFGLGNGITPDEMQELLYQCYPYVGFPAVSTAIRVMIEVLRETGQEGGAKTAHERGML